MNSFNFTYNDIIINEKSKFSNYALAALLGTSQLIGNTSEAKSKPEITQSINYSNMKFSLSEQKNIIARTLWAEARGEGEKGMRAVASVIYNRANGKIPNFVPVIIKPKQFSCWNAMSPSDWQNYKIKTEKGVSWELVNKIAHEMITDNFKPITDANHYYNPKKASPSWSNDKNGNPRPHFIIGNHKFLRI